MLRSALTALLLGLAGAGTAASPGGRIFFTSDWQPHFRTSEIFLASAVTGRTANLTRNEVDDTDPAWSPDGTTIVFSSSRDGNDELYTMRADGSDVRRLTFTDAAESQPAWSPDGTRIAFTSTVPDEESWYDAVFVMNRDGTGRRQITGPDDDANDPSWSPDGKQLAVQIGGYEEGRVAIVSVDGGARRDLPPITVGEPAWSPDGTRIAYTHFRDQLNTSDVWVIDVDGSNAHKVATFASTPAWSPDGTRVAVVRWPRVVNSDGGVYEVGGLTVGIVGADGRGMHNVFPRAVRGDLSYSDWTEDGVDLDPRGTTYFGLSWAFDGKRLVFGRRTEARPRDVWSIDGDGTRMRNLTHERAESALRPIPSPNGERALYTMYGRNGWELWLVRSDGTGRRRIDSRGNEAAWAPDSRRFAFTRRLDSLGSHTAVYVGGIGERARLIGDGYGASWSRDGRKIAFARLEGDGNYRSSSILLATPNGSVRTLAFLSHRQAYDLSWSPDGRRIAFSADHSLEGSIIAWVGVVDVASGRVRYLTHAKFEDTSVSWSPHGDWIAFERLQPNVDERDIVYVIRPSGRGMQRVARSRRDSAPSWSPDGHRLVFMRRFGHEEDLVTARPDGGDLRRLTRNGADEAEPVWVR